jgi:hypothetical protein
MKAYNGTKWVVVLRVLAAKVQGSILTPYPVGSQVGLNTEVEAGYVLTDGLGGTFHGPDGNLLTTTTPVASIDTGSLTKLEGTQTVAQANENIPRFTAVYLVGGRASIASSMVPDNEKKAPIAVVTVDAAQNDIVELVTAGRTVSNEQWSFDSADIGKSVYCTGLGQITVNKPTAAKNVRVGTIVDNHSVLLSFDWETEVAPQNLASGFTLYSTPLKVTMSGTGSSAFPVLGITKATAAQDGYLAAADFARIPALEQSLLTKTSVEWGYAAAGATTLSTGSPLGVPIDAASQLGALGIRAFNTYGGLAAAGIADQYAQTGTPAWNISNYLNQNSPLNGTASIRVPTMLNGVSIAGIMFNVSLEVMIDPQYIGLPAASTVSPPALQSAPVCASFQFWNGFIPEAQLDSAQPTAELAATKRIVQKDILYPGYSRLTPIIASGQVWLPVGINYVTFALDPSFPLANGLQAPNGLQFSTIAGFKMTFEKVFAGV